ncbi:hypothetical protein KXS07_31670 [Inquilinus limosus]|uniref:hypothetical protein n=1 Tax=Inquilinus limosus TaxID=171674 RepID=UPI003F155A12
MPAELLRRDPNIGALSKKARYGVSGRLRSGGSVLLLLGLAACGGDNAAQQAGLRCPQIVIPQDAAVYDLVRNNSTNPKDVLVEARITNTRGDCTYGDNAVTMNVNVEFTAWRGPAAWLEKDVPVQYFVAVTDAQDRILNKANFDVKIPVPRLQVTPRETIQEPLEQVIPVSSPAEGGSYKVMIGFQLTPQQLEFNKHRNDPRTPGAAAQAAGRRTIAPVVPDPRDPSTGGPPQ